MPRAGLALALMYFGSILAASEVPPADKPNIIFIMADDLGYGDLGCYGQRHIRTPNIDRLAAEGMRFTQCYAGSAVCAPSRCVLMTGMHTGHARVRGNAAAIDTGAFQRRVPLLDEDVTVAEYLKHAGYATGVVGKWGLGEPDTTGIPNRQGFDFWFGYLNQQHAHTYYPDYLWKNTERVELTGNTGGGRAQWTHDLMTHEALDFIDAHHREAFFLYLPYTVPHGKLEVPDESPYQDEPWPENLRRYAAMVTRLDADVGRIMDRLRKLGLDKRTAVFFTSDNGGEPGYIDGSRFFNSWAHFRGTKSTVYEGGLRVPMIARWPGHIAAGATSDQPWTFADFLPTCAELAHVAVTERVDGRSVVPLLEGREWTPHEFLYWEYGGAQVARAGDWKLIRNRQGRIELYNLAKDESEASNVADDNPDVVARLVKILDREHVETPLWPLARQQTSS